MSYTLPRGTKDILPDEIEYWQYIEKTAKDFFDVYQYHEIRTPIFESTGLFERGIGSETDIVEKEMYTFFDKGDRSLTLRPEGTACVVRSAIQHNLVARSNTAKLFYTGPMFRYERPQAGRYRQFYQIGAELLGNQHPCTDSELISLAIRLFQKLGLKKLTVKINSVGCPICRPVIEERLKQFLGDKLPYLCSDCNRRFVANPLRILDCKNSTCNTYFAALPSIEGSLCRDCGDHFSTVLEYLDRLKIPFEVDPRLVRGLDYYTKTAFEIQSDLLGAQSAICGGGRYDGLVKQLGGPDTPAVGFAFGLDRMVMILKMLSKPLLNKGKLIALAPIGASQLPICFDTMDKLRQMGIRCDLNFEKDTLKTHLKFANKIKADYAVIIGESESEKKIALIKNFKTGEQTEVTQAKLIQYIMKLCLI